jgi:hypothetical protein
MFYNANISLDARKKGTFPQGEAPKAISGKGGNSFVAENYKKGGIG